MVFRFEEINVLNGLYCRLDNLRANHCCVFVQLFQEQQSFASYSLLGLSHPTELPTVIEVKLNHHGFVCSSGLSRQPPRKQFQVRLPPPSLLLHPSDRQVQLQQLTGHPFLVLLQHLLFPENQLLPQPVKGPPNTLQIGSHGGVQYCNAVYYFATLPG